MSFNDFIAGIDPLKLEAERFGLTPEQAREMLTKKKTVRKRAKSTRRNSDIKKFQLKRESITKELNLTVAQQNAVDNWLKGLG